MSGYYKSVDDLKKLAHDGATLDMSGYYKQAWYTLFISKDGATLDMSGYYKILIPPRVDAEMEPLWI